MNPQFANFLQTNTSYNIAKNFSFVSDPMRMIQLPSVEYQAMLFRAQVLQYKQAEEMRRRSLQLKIEPILEPQIQLKYECDTELQERITDERNLKTETSLSPTSEKNLKVFSSNFTQDAPQDQLMSKDSERCYVKLSLREQLNFNAFLLRELDKIVRSIIANMGKDKQTEIDAMRNQYLDNQPLLQTFNKLTMKYYSAKKCKEDIVRYILRKAFKVMKTSVGKEAKVCGKKASLLLCKKYFQSKFSEIEEAGVDMENGDEILEFLMPYRKNSKNKTMNTSFVMEVFSSEEFSKAYQKFLESFRDIILEDNEKKIEKLVNFLSECVKKDCIAKLGSFSRLPWLEVWIEDTEEIAASLLPTKDFNSNNKSKKMRSS